MSYRVCLVGLLAGAALLPSLSWGSQLKPSSRLAIVRALTAEYATSKVPLPKGENGLFLKTNGEVEQKSLTEEITKNGTAVPPNVLVQITGIEFQEQEILFEINGGGKRKTKWYEHVEVGIGYGTHPLGTGADAGTPTGSMITLVFPKKLTDVSVEEVKSYLAPVLDFTAQTPIQTLSRPIPPEFQKAIAAKQAVAGMDRDMVLAAMGQPDRKVREIVDDVEQEEWIYGTPPLKVIFVTFEGDEVVDVQEYLGGVTGKSEQPYPEEPPR